MKSSILFIVLFLLTTFGVIATQGGFQFDDRLKQSINYEKIFAEEKNFASETTTILRNNITNIGSNRPDTIVKNRYIPKVERVVLVKEKIDTIVDIKYKTITRNIYVGNQFNQKNNLKIDTSDASKQ